jgi:hypothetical protein
MESLQLKSGLQLHGYNWNDDSDSGKPIVQGPDTAQQTMFGQNVSDVLIEGFEIHIPNNIYENLLYCVFLKSDFDNHTSGCTVRDNYFTGYIDNPTGDGGDEWELLRVWAVDDLIVEDNLFADCHVTSEKGGFLAGMWIVSCENLIVRRNRIIDNASANAFAGIIADYADNMFIYENEVGNWTRLQSIYVELAWAINIVSDCMHCQIYNNEVHDIDPTPGRTDAAGIFVRVIGTNPGVWEVHNNLVYNMHASNPDQLSDYTAYNRGIFFRLDTSSVHIAKLEIANNTVYKQTSGFYNSGVHLEKHSSAQIDELNIFNNIVVKQIGPDEVATYDPTAAYRLDYSLVEDKIDFCLAYDLEHLTFYGFEEGVGFLDNSDPLFVDPGAGDFSFPASSPAEQGSPYIVDWDDTGDPSGDPDNTDINTRSRMGCFGGPLGDWVPPSQQ